MPIHIPDAAPRPYPSGPSSSPMPLSYWSDGSWTSLLVVAGSQPEDLFILTKSPPFRSPLLSSIGPSLVLTSFLFLFHLHIPCFISIFGVNFVTVRLHCLALRIEPVLPLVHQYPIPQSINPSRLIEPTVLTHSPRDNTCSHINVDSLRKFRDCCPLTHSRHFIPIPTTTCATISSSPYHLQRPIRA